MSGFCAEGGREERQRNGGREGQREGKKAVWCFAFRIPFAVSTLYLKPEKLLLKHQFILQEGRRGVQRVCGVKCLREGSVTHNFHEGS